MTSMQKWILEMANAIVMGDEEAERSITTSIVQRIGSGLLQARAKEARDISGELLIKMTPRVLAGLSKQEIVTSISIGLRERSSKLEALSLEAAKTWPLDSPTTPLPEEKLVKLALN